MLKKNKFIKELISGYHIKYNFNKQKIVPIIVFS